MLLLGVSVDLIGFDFLIHFTIISPFFLFLVLSWGRGILLLPSNQVVRVIRLFVDMPATSTSPLQPRCTDPTFITLAS